MRSKPTPVAAAVRSCRRVGRSSPPPRPAPHLCPQMAWRHCLMVAGGESIAEQFGFVVRAASSGLLAALDQYLDAGLVEYAPLVEPYIECPNRYGPLPAYQTN